MRVYLAPGVPNPHPVVKELIRNPPVRYVSPNRWGAERPEFAASDLFWWAQATLMRLMSMCGLPKMGLVPGRGFDLIHACQFLVLNRTPWVVEVADHVNGFGYTRSFRQLQNRRFLRLVERALSSDRCRKVLPYTPALARNLERHLNADGFRHKIEIVPPSRPAVSEIKRTAGSVVSLLFIGNRFYEKGGRETLEAFSRLRRLVHAELRLTLVSYDIPEPVHSRFRGDPAVCLLPSEDSIGMTARSRFKRSTARLGMPIPRSLPESTISDLFRAADIFVCPTFVDTTFVYLEAMAYGLPIVASDVAHGPELVEDGITGFIIPSPINWMDGGTREEWQDRRSFQRLVQAGRFECVVSDLMDRLGTLIENPSLRRKMGEEGRRRIENGPFSVKARNEKLRRIYAEALGKKSGDIVVM